MQQRRARNSGSESCGTKLFVWSDALGLGKAEFGLTVSDNVQVVGFVHGQTDRTPAL